jgi:hypothetical protein
LCQALGRSLYIDEATAKFYLEDAGGDMKTAMEAFGEWAPNSNQVRIPLSNLISNLSLDFEFCHMRGVCAYRGRIAGAEE